MATLLCPRSSCLRAAAQHVRSLTASTASPAAFTTSARPLKQLRLSHQTTLNTPAILSRIPAARLAKPTTSRHASTTTSAPTEPPQELLTWDRFFDLRRKRRYVSTGASVMTAIAAVGIAAPLIEKQDLDTWGAQVSGMDPFIVLGISTFGVAVLGWLCGPTFGNAGFGVWAGKRGWKRAIAEKEKSFYARIKRYRADPSASSPQNPIPDYYGEKITSVKDYRRWLKDQRAFNRKKNRALL